MIALALICALLIALIGGALILFQTKAMWTMDSPNARAWNATLNTTATFGINIIPILIIIICGAIIGLIIFSTRGF